jgi:chemotaxis-related protein WspB
MMFLLFHLGKDRYVLEARHVIEVLPLLELKKIPEAPRGVAGMFSYRGRPVPAIDLNELTLGQPAAQCLSTRIVIINYPDESGKLHPLGLIAERATEIIRREASEFTQPGLRFGDTPYLGPVLTDGSGVIQWVYDQRLLSEKVRDVLFCETAEVVP